MTRAKDDFWAITSYFNLTGGSRRLRNYHCFRRHLSVPLLTVEWHPDRRFELSEGDADMVLQIGGGDLMWQKERLLSLAVAALPDYVKYVAWLDCDVLFENPAWAEEARGSLERNAAIQLFAEAVRLGEDESVSLAGSREPDLGRAATDRISPQTSFTRVFENLREGAAGVDLDGRFKPRAGSSIDPAPRPARGLAWAAQIDFLRDIGFYERCIVGGGDTQFCYGVSGLWPQLIDAYKAAGWAFYADCQTYRDWAVRASAACDGRLGSLGGRILHLFHGSATNRLHNSRRDGLVPFALDLDRDIYAEAGQPWSWRRDRDQLNAYFLNYMRARKEDEGIAAIAVKGTEV